MHKYHAFNNLRQDKMSGARLISAYRLCPDGVRVRAGLAVF